MVIDVETNGGGMPASTMEDNNRLATTESSSSLGLTQVLAVASKIPSSVDLKCRERVADSDAEEHDQSGKKLNLGAMNVRKDTPLLLLSS